MKFLYISTGNGFPFDEHLIDGLRENGHEVFELVKKNDSYRSFLSRFKNITFPYDSIIVGYSLPLIVPIVRLLSRKKIVFNAVASQYEANIVSRNYGDPWSFPACKSSAIDLLYFYFASTVLLDSNAQVDFINKLYLIPRKKMIRSWSGVDEKTFIFDPSVQKNERFTILFRGRFLPESGILTVIEAAKILEKKNVEFIVIGHGFMYREVNALMENLNPKNLSILSEKLSVSEMLTIMLSSHISLGQLADHPRLGRTLPCKLFETLALKLPYLTGRNHGALELLADGENCITVNPGDAKDLSEKILFLKEHPEILHKIAENGHSLYKEKLTSKHLAKEFIDNCFSKI